MWIRKKIKKKTIIDVDRGLTREEYKRYINEVFNYLNEFLVTYTNNEYKNGQRDAFYLMADVLKCQIINDEINIDFDIKKYVDKILNLR